MHTLVVFNEINRQQPYDQISETNDYNWMQFFCIWSPNLLCMNPQCQQSREEIENIRKF